MAYLCEYFCKKVMYLWNLPSSKVSYLLMVQWSEPDKDTKWHGSYGSWRYTWRYVATLEISELSPAFRWHKSFNLQKFGTLDLIYPAWPACAVRDAVGKKKYRAHLITNLVPHTPFCFYRTLAHRLWRGAGDAISRHILASHDVSRNFRLGPADRLNVTDGRGRGRSRSAAAQHPADAATATHN